MEMAIEAVEAVDTKPLELKQQSITSRITDLVVDSDDSLRECEAIVVDAGDAIKRVRAELDPGIAKANATHKHLTKQRMGFLGPLEAVVLTGKGKGAKYRRQLEEDRRAKEAELRAAELKAAQERQLAEAVELADAGHAEAADEALEQPTIPIPIVVESAAPPPPARLYREAWTCRIDNPGLVPREWCVPDEKALNARARSLKGQAGPIPGVTFYDASGL